MFSRTAAALILAASLSLPLLSEPANTRELHRKYEKEVALKVKTAKQQPIKIS
jgi:hypothetical protein